MMLMISSSATVADWNKIQSVNVVGTMLCYKYAAMQMIKQGRGGRIVGMRVLFTSVGWVAIDIISQERALLAASEVSIAFSRVSRSLIPILLGQPHLNWLHIVHRSSQFAASLKQLVSEAMLCSIFHRD